MTIRIAYSRTGVPTVTHDEPTTTTQPTTYDLRTDRSTVRVDLGGRVYTGLVAEDLDTETDDGAALVCHDCGDTYYGSCCDRCTPCDDCGLLPVFCDCESDSTEPLDY